MRQMIKCTLAVAMCLALLVPPAWGRPKDYGDAVPWSDEIEQREAASAPSQMLLFRWQQSWPMPFIYVIKVKTTVGSTKGVTPRVDAREHACSKKGVHR
jgi:hypothetical protein